MGRISEYDQVGQDIIRGRRDAFTPKKRNVGKDMADRLLEETRRSTKAPSPPAYRLGAKMPHPFLSLLPWLIVVLGLLLAAIAVSKAWGGEKETREYFPVTVSWLATQAPDAAVPTHVAVEAWVRETRKEGDGDRHLKLCQLPGWAPNRPDVCLVAEIIPLLPLEAPHKGQYIRVFGITRYDGKHRQREIHPVERWEAIP